MHVSVKFFSLAGLSIAMLAACNPNERSDPQQEILALEKEVLRIHDEVMPKMSDIARLSEILDTEAKNPNVDSLTRIDIIRSLTVLDTGDSLMWEWMHKYKKPEHKPLDSIYIYLRSEKTRIENVRGVMLEGINNAESLAQKLGHGQPN